ncbi:MAG: translation elongation factor Ts [Candidatus Blackburnbacteria bacterium]|nr:translation elongation factor Ts [Candidatus Blackburnbacteria bacterium]
MSISLDQIKKLRKATSASVMDVKRALEESRGNEDKARQILKEAGFTRAAKKASRETKTGRIFSYIHHSGTVGSIVAILCETDFVARTDEFQELGREIAMQIASMKPESVEDLKKQDYIRDPSTTIDALVQGVIAKTGENIQIQDFKRFEI